MATFKIGDHVRLMAYRSGTKAEIVEVRGNVGAEGRLLLRIRLLDPYDPAEFEVPAVEVERIEPEVAHAS